MLKINPLLEKYYQVETENIGQVCLYMCRCGGVPYQVRRGLSHRQCLPERLLLRGNRGRLLSPGSQGDPQGHPHVHH